MENRRKYGFGSVAERFKAAVLKTAVDRLQTISLYPLFQTKNKQYQRTRAGAKLAQFAFFRANKIGSLRHRTRHSLFAFCIPFRIFS